MRQMVTLHILFRNEEEEVIAEMQFIQKYEENEDLMLYKKKFIDI